VQLARRGWQVTGVDMVAKALRRARERVEAAISRVFKFDEHFFRLRRA
jgi:2-polyprenyl-3-methyl-5-hydroxy-6-metoxy-1,4-benzoquinol methylase